MLHDLPASLVTFLVALPLSTGIALASGAPVTAGLISAVVGGVVVGALAGAPLQVSGPAAGLVVMVFGSIERFGLRTTAAIVVAAGVIQAVLGAARVARIALAISPAVIHGMLAGIGIQIALSQLHVVLGGSPQSSAFKNLRELPAQVAHMHGAAVALGMLSIAALLLWPRLPWKKLRVVPAPLVAVVLGTLAAAVGATQVPRVTVPARFTDALVLPALPRIDLLPAAAVMAVSLAIVASAESLLSAVATDKLHGGARAKLDRELLAQGVGNIVAGLLGGLPVTGVVVRSTANISAGARTRLATMLHGVWVLLFVTLLGGVLGRIPLAVLAGLLVVVGAKLVNPEHIAELRKHRQLGIYLVTLAGVLAINLLAGIALGLAASAIQLLRRLTHVRASATERDGVWRVFVQGSVTFLGLPRLAGALAAVPAGAEVVVDLEVELLDHAAWEALEAFRVAHTRTGGVVHMDEAHQIWTALPASPFPAAAEALAEDVPSPAA